MTCSHTTTPDTAPPAEGADAASGGASGGPYQPGPLRKVIDTPVVWLILILVLAYRATLGPFMGGACRHIPTCSQYMLDAVAKYGPYRGAWKGLGRILRCRPGGTHGYDPA